MLMLSKNQTNIQFPRQKIEEKNNAAGNFIARTGKGNNSILKKLSFFLFEAIH